MRATWLAALADAIEAERDDLATLADRETNLGLPRLRQEVGRTAGQLRLFAETIRTGEHLGLTSDRGDGVAPVLHQTLVPLGPVLVFAASNFPFAFSVLGGDTASALAAGCPVVVKGHPGHPDLSRATYGIARRALQEAGAPDGTLGLVLGTDDGVQALEDPRIRAAAFTGSQQGGVFLHNIATSRPDPIPFYGELGSVNPVYALPGAVRTRGQEIAEGFVASFVLGTGQFCTKPGLLFLPTGHGLHPMLSDLVGDVAPTRMLNDRIRDLFAEGVESLLSAEPVKPLTTGRSADGTVSPTLISATATDVLEHPELFTREYFGPVSIVVDYDNEPQLLEVARELPGCLTCSIHADDEPTQTIVDLLAIVQTKAGRIVWNGWPTGVAVSPAMNHGGPYPATVGSIFTSVGTDALRRFQRALCLQGFPDEYLPLELRGDSTATALAAPAT